MTAPPDRRPVRRHVLYIPGYATASPARHHALFRREAARFARLWGVETAVGDLDPLSSWEHGATWRATTHAGVATVETVVEVLRWDDLVAADFATSAVEKAARGLVTLADAVWSGTLLRVARAAPWFAFAWIYPFLGLFVCAGAGAAIGAKVAGYVGPLLAAAAGIATAVAALESLRRTPLFVTHLLDDWNAQRRYLRRTDLVLDRRLKAFAARLSEVAANDDVDEVLVVGHSSGSFLAIDVVARAFEADPVLGRGGAPLSLLTLGGVELLIALHPQAAWFRDRIGRLAAEPALFWASIACRGDSLCFPRRNPLKQLGLAVARDRPNPRFVRVSLRRLLTQSTIRRLALGLKVFRVHFQYVMANELQAPYDFFAIVCGAPTVRAQFARPKRELMRPHAAGCGNAPNCAEFDGGVTVQAHV